MKGFTLIEVLVSMGILATAIVAVVVIFPIGANNVLFATNQSTMAEEARTQFDRIRALGVQNLPANIKDLTIGQVDNLYSQDLKDALKTRYSQMHPQTTATNIPPGEIRPQLEILRKLLREEDAGSALYRHAALFHLAQADAVYGLFFNADRDYYRVTCEFEHRSGDTEKFVTFLSRR